VQGGGLSLRDDGRWIDARSQRAHRAQRQKSASSAPTARARPRSSACCSASSHRKSAQSSKARGSRSFTSTSSAAFDDTMRVQMRSPTATRPHDQRRTRHVISYLEDFLFEPARCPHADQRRSPAASEPACCSRASSRNRATCSCSTSRRTISTPKRARAARDLLVEFAARCCS